MDIRIDDLVNHPKTLPILAQLLFEEWPHHSPNGLADGMVINLQGRMHQDRLPLVLVALEREQPIGTVSLKIREVETRFQYGHYKKLGWVEVERPEYRARPAVVMKTATNS